MAFADGRRVLAGARVTRECESVNVDLRFGGNNFTYRKLFHSLIGNCFITCHLLIETTVGCVPHIGLFREIQRKLNFWDVPAQLGCKPDVPRVSMGCLDNIPHPELTCLATYKYQNFHTARSKHPAGARWST